MITILAHITALLASPPPGAQFRRTEHAHPKVYCRCAVTIWVLLCVHFQVSKISLHLERGNDSRIICINVARIGTLQVRNNRS